MAKQWWEDDEVVSAAPQSAGATPSGDQWWSQDEVVKPTPVNTNAKLDSAGHAYSPLSPSIPHEPQNTSMLSQVPGVLKDYGAGFGKKGVDMLLSASEWAGDHGLDRLADPLGIDRLSDESQAKITQDTKDYLRKNDPAKLKIFEENEARYGAAKTSREKVDATKQAIGVGNPEGGVQDAGALVAGALPYVAVPGPAEGLGAKMLFGAAQGYLTPKVFDAASDEQAAVSGGVGAAIPAGGWLLQKGAAPFKQYVMPEIEAAMKEFGVTKPPVSTISSSPTVAKIEELASRGIGSGGVRQDIEKAAQQFSEGSSKAASDLATKSEQEAAALAAKHGSAQQSAVSRGNQAAADLAAKSEKDAAEFASRQEADAAGRKAMSVRDAQELAARHQKEMADLQARHAQEATGLAESGEKKAAELAARGQEIASAGDQDAAGQLAAKGQLAFRKAYGTTADDMYDVVGEHLAAKPVKVDTSRMMSVLKDIIGDKQKVAKGGISGAADFFESIAEANKNGQDAEVFVPLMREIGHRVRDFGKAQSGEKAQLEALWAAMRNDLKDAFASQNPEAGAAFEAATSKAKDSLEKLKNPAIASIRKLARAGQFDKVVERVFKPSMSVHDIPVVMEVIGNDGRKAAQDAVQQRLINGAVDLNGKINVGKLSASMAKFGDDKLAAILRNEQIDQLKALASEGTALESSQAEAAANLKNTSKSELAALKQQSASKSKVLQQGVAEQSAAAKKAAADEAAALAKKTGEAKSALKNSRRQEMESLKNARNTESSALKESQRSAKTQLQSKTTTLNRAIGKSQKAADRPYLNLPLPLKLGAKLAEAPFLPAEFAARKFVGSDLGRQWLTKGFQLPNMSLQLNAGAQTLLDHSRDSESAANMKTRNEEQHRQAVEEFLRRLETEAELSKAQ